MEPIECALIGYGGIAEFHAEALKQIEGAHIRTIVGRREEPAKAFAKRHGVEHSTVDLDQALSDDAIDAIIVTSPSELHHDQTARALEAGKHVLVEIPIALSHEGARTLAGLAGKVDRKVLVAHTRRFDDVGRFTKEFIESGKTGAIYSGALTDYLQRLGPHELRPIGSSLKICLVAEGQADFYPRLGLTSEWDTAAAQAILESAGGSMMNPAGQVLRYNTKDGLLNPYFLAFGDPDRDWPTAVSDD